MSLQRTRAYVHKMKLSPAVPLFGHDNGGSRRSDPVGYEQVDKVRKGREILGWRAPDDFSWSSRRNAISENETSNQSAHTHNARIQNPLYEFSLAVKMSAQKDCIACMDTFCPCFSLDSIPDFLLSSWESKAIAAAYSFGLMSDAKVANAYRDSRVARLVPHSSRTHHGRRRTRSRVSTTLLVPTMQWLLFIAACMIHHGF